MGGAQKPKQSGRHFRSPSQSAGRASKLVEDNCNFGLRTHLVSVRIHDSQIVRVGNLLPVILVRFGGGPTAVVTDPRTRETIGSLFPPEIDTLINFGRNAVIQSC